MDQQQRIDRVRNAVSKMSECQQVLQSALKDIELNNISSWLPENAPYSTYLDVCQESIKAAMAVIQVTEFVRPAPL